MKLTVKSCHAFLIALAIFSGGQALGKDSETLQRYLDKVVEETNAPSLSVAVAVGGKIIAAASGYADKDKSIKATSTTQYRTASIAKVVSTTAFMTLVESGQVALSDNIRQYLPYFPKKKRGEITIEHLLTHTSGIRGYSFGEYGTNTHYDSLEESSKVFRDDPLLFEPGSNYNYSTYGINLIQGVIEKVTDGSAADFLERVLFKKANMKQTELEFHDKEYPNLSIGYRSLLSFIPVSDIDVSNKFLGGGMLSTPTDLVNMVVALNQGKVLKPETKELMWSIPLQKIAASQTYGWEWINFRNIRAVSMDGAINGFESLLLYVPEGDVTVALMVNQDDYDFTGRTTLDIAEMFLKRQSQPKVKS